MFQAGLKRCLGSGKQYGRVVSSLVGQAETGVSSPRALHQGYTNTGGAASLQEGHKRLAEGHSKRFQSTQPSASQEVEASEHATVTGQDAKTVTLQWTEPEQQVSTYHAAWLKHTCHCPLCKHEETRQRISDTYNFLPAYTLKSAHIEGDILKVEWMEDPGHVGIFPLDFLRKHAYDDDARARAREAKKPLYWTGKDMPTVQYEDVMNSETGLLQWLEHLSDYGLCLVKGLPSKDGASKEVVERIWTLQSTIYGDMFDVKSSELGAINIAYTTVGLHHHMDLPYYESPPGLQFLHCLKLDACVEGGENSFLDNFLLAEKLRDQHPEDFETLVRVPVTWEKLSFNRERPVSMVIQRPHISLNSYGDVIGIRWAPSHEGPLRVPPEDVEPYYRAYQRFASMVNDSKDKVVYRMEEGDMCSFNNRRMMHAREGFKLNGGERHLQGCYVNICEFKSRYEVLSRFYGDGRPSRRVGNYDLQ